jgi:hypothetical protein
MPQMFDMVMMKEQKNNGGSWRTTTAGFSTLLNYCSNNG